MAVVTADVGASALEASVSRSRGSSFAGSYRIALGLAVVVLVGAVALLAGVVSPFDPNRQSLLDNLTAPSLTPLHPGQAPHLAGTDRLGRDVLSRVIYGGRVSLAIAVTTSVLAGIVGVGAGLAAGYARGALDRILMRVADVQLAFPFMVLAIVVIVALGPGATAVTVTLALWGWVPFARVTRAEVLVVRKTEYVNAAIAIGASPFRVAFRHVLPNASSSILVTATFFVGVVLLSEGALSFIGLGVQPPDPSWGQMIAEGRAMLTTAPWISLAPGIPLSFLVLAVNVLGDALNDVLDPRARSR